MHPNPYAPRIRPATSIAALGRNRMIARRRRGSEGERDIAIGIRGFAAVERHGSAMLRPPALIVLVTARKGNHIGSECDSLAADGLAIAGHAGAQGVHRSAGFDVRQCAGRAAGALETNAGVTFTGG